MAPPMLLIKVEFTRWVSKVDSCWRSQCKTTVTIASSTTWRHVTTQGHKIHYYQGKSYCIMHKIPPSVVAGENFSYVKVFPTLGGKVLCDYLHKISPPLGEKKWLCVILMLHVCACLTCWWSSLLCSRHFINVGQSASVLIWTQQKPFSELNDICISTCDQNF